MGRGVIIAGTHSGAGKTTVSVGIMAALKARGLAVQPYKVGPDFIDPAYHNFVTGRFSRNLDGWMMGKAAVRDVFERVGAGADIRVIEGVMGLFDGIGKDGLSGSTAEVAKLTGAPVVLVVDASSMSGSAAAVVKGFETLERGVNVAGVILNRVGSKRHEELLRQAIGRRCRAAVIGAIPRDKELDIPSRHLGLTTDVAGILTKKFMRTLTGIIEKNVDMRELLKIAGEKPSPPAPLPGAGEGRKTISLAPCGRGIKGEGDTARLAVAMDEAFCFYYRDNLELLESYGLELVPFSPLKDGGLPEGVSGVYLGGGYPEMYARGLASNDFVKRDILEAAKAGVPIYAECGGFMYLTRGITDMDGVFHTMCGLFPTRARMLEGRKALGYREVIVQAKDSIFPEGRTARGHEFHYSEMEPTGRGVKRAYKVRKGGTDDGWSAEGCTVYNTLASYVHLHFLSNKGFARHFAEKVKGGLRWRRR